MNVMPQPLSSMGHPLDLADTAFGLPTPSEPLLGQPDKLRARLEADGYLYIRGFFPSPTIMRARRSLTDRLAAEHLLHPDHPAIEAVAAPGVDSHFRPDLAKDNPHVDEVVHGSKLLEFYASLLGGPVRHYDYTWLRAVGPGHGTKPHCDLVYMGRGTHELLTCWIPYGDVPLELGGLIVLEQSHLKSDVLGSYLSRDVDSYCVNRPAEAALAQEGKSSWSGHLSNNPHSLQKKLGGRWLTAEWRAGDFITFKMNLVHGSLDNHTDRIRLSSDTRYQLASEPADERWIGPAPSGHGRAGKRGRIC